MTTSRSSSTIDPKIGFAIFACLIAIVVLIAMQGGLNAQPDITDVKGVQVERNGSPDSQKQRADDVEGSF